MKFKVGDKCITVDNPHWEKQYHGIEIIIESVRDPYNSSLSIISYPYSGFSPLFNTRFVFEESDLKPHNEYYNQQTIKKALGIEDEV